VPHAALPWVAHARPSRWAHAPIGTTGRMRPVSGPHMCGPAGGACAAPHSIGLSPRGFIYSDLTFS